MAVLASPKDKGEAVEYFTFALRVFSQTMCDIWQGQEVVLGKPLKGKVENAFNTVCW